MGFQNNGNKLGFILKLPSSHHIQILLTFTSEHRHQHSYTHSKLSLSFSLSCIDCLSLRFLRLPN